MRKVRFFLLALVFLGALTALPYQARAEGEYVKPSLANFFKTLVRFGAVDIRSEKMLDVYARVVECKIYKKYYGNDFEWVKIRKAIKESIKNDIGSFPMAYYFDSVLQLGRYDFKNGFYRFTDKTAQTRSNVFTIRAHDEERCTEERTFFPPLTYQFILDTPLKMLGLPLTADEGRLLLERMEQAKNNDRLIYVRFNFRVAYIAALTSGENEKYSYEQANQKRLGPLVTQTAWDGIVSIDARIDSIDYYEDEAHTKLIYTYLP